MTGIGGKDHLHFTPVVGSDYDHGFAHGMKLLVLGESHYGDDRGADMTRYWLDAHISKSFSPTWRGCEKVLAYCQPPRGKSVWSSVAFANFVQVCMQSRDDRPQDADWQTGRDAFAELLDHVKPDVLLILGWATWQELPWHEWPWEHECPSSLRTADDEWGVVYQRPDGARSVAGFIYHPASPGWRAESWYPHVDRLLGAASEVLAA